MPRAKKKSGGINSWPKGDRPREKLLERGEHTLTDSELLAILLRTGRKGESALSLARKILKKFKTFRNMSRADITLWTEFKGLGQAKLAQIRAAIEIGRRFGEQELAVRPGVIKSSRDILPLVMPRMRDLSREVFKAIFLNAKNRVISITEIEEGTVDRAHPVMRELFHRALQQSAVSFICVHNHPSGDPAPSREDRTFTRTLAGAADVMQVRMLDHIIIGDNRYYSFADSGDL